MNIPIVSNDFEGEEYQKDPYPFDWQQVVSKFQYFSQSWYFWIGKSEIIKNVLFPV